MDCKVCGRPEDRLSADCPRSDIHFICLTAKTRWPGLLKEAIP